MLKYWLLLCHQNKNYVINKSLTAARKIKLEDK
jgi:hypothetical protein